MTSSEYEKYVTKIVRQFDFCKDECRDEYFLRRLHAASINAIFRDAYALITSHEDWRRLETLERPVQWEDSSIKKHTAFELPTTGVIPERLIGELLKSVAGGDQGAFRSLIKYREILDFDWPV